MDKHTGQDLKGKAKEAAGDMFGDKSMELEGKTDQAAVAAKRSVDDVVDKTADKAGDAMDNIKDKLSRDDDRM